MMNLFCVFGYIKICMTPVELLQINPGVIQRLIDRNEYSSTQLDMRILADIVCQMGFPASEAECLYQDIEENQMELHVTKPREINLMVGDELLSSRDGILNAWTTLMSHRTGLLSSIIDEALSKGNASSCLYFDCDNSFWYRPRETIYPEALVVFQISSWVDLVATLDNLLYSLMNRSVSSPSLVIVSSLSTVFRKLSRDDSSSSSRQIISHIVATCARINEISNTLVVLEHDLNNPAVHPSLVAHYRAALKQHRHKSIQI